MQNYTEIPSTRTLSDSLAEILNNDKTALSCSSGTAFPTTNLQLGMLCFRSDLIKLYQLVATSPVTWRLIMDASSDVDTQFAAKLNASSYTAADVLAKLKTVDGSDSGVDADLLDGQHASAFATSGHNHDAAYLGISAKAADSEKLDGLDSTAFAAASHSHSYLPLPGGTLTGDIVFGTSDRDKSPMGTYDSTKTQQIWSMGASYRNSSTGVNFGTLYGAAYKHTNNVTGGTMAGGHQMVWCQNGVGTAAIGTDIWTSGNVTAYSDIRVKTNLQVIADALTKVHQLHGYTFERTDVALDEGGQPMSARRQTGVVAQEVLLVLPEAVTGSEDSHYSVAYGNLVGLLIEAIKELDGKVQALQLLLSRSAQEA